MTKSGQEVLHCESHIFTCWACTSWGWIPAASRARYGVSQYMPVPSMVAAHGSTTSTRPASCGRLARTHPASCFTLSLGGSGTARTRYSTPADVAGLFLLCVQAPARGRVRCGAQRGTDRSVWIAGTKPPERFATRGRFRYRVFNHVARAATCGRLCHAAVRSRDISCRRGEHARS